MKLKLSYLYKEFGAPSSSIVELRCWSCVLKFPIKLSKLKRNFAVTIYDRKE